MCSWILVGSPYVKDKIHTNSYTEHICNRVSTLWNMGKKGKEKRMMSISDIVKHIICCCGMVVRGETKRHSEEWRTQVFIFTLAGPDLYQCLSTEQRIHEIFKR
jgi:hypothetical protein